MRVVSVNTKGGKINFLENYIGQSGTYFFIILKNSNNFQQKNPEKGQYIANKN